MNAITLRREARLDALNTTEMVVQQRTVRLTAASFEVWRILCDGKAQPYPMSADTLPQIEAALGTETNHGANFIVRETATISGRTVMHSYRVRRGKWAGRYADARKVYPHHADKLFSVEASFEPVEPWRCVPGADRLGVTGIVEGKRHG